MSSQDRTACTSNARKLSYNNRKEAISRKAIMNPAEQQKIEDICDEIFMTIDELGFGSPDKLAEDLIRDGGRSDLATKPEEVEEIAAEITKLQGDLGALNENVDTIQDMIISPADGDKSFVEDEAHAAKSHQSNMKIVLSVLLDIAKRNDTDKNNLTLNAIAENIDHACKSIDDLVKELYKAYDR